ncbi:glycogen debranching N-terminal domain-containing protein [Plantactinospora sp. B24E8]|uniref:amylo-alpha-1,6-glucosidase n=1 Tax=Plantactinospora sp. B24E8 TaxID=3153567 RepID=UPI00325DC0AC
MTNTVGRPTPADPTPGAAPPDQTPSPVVRNLPPDLGPDAVGIFEGMSFLISNRVGDVPPGSIGGLVHHDTRLLNRWELTLDDAPLLVLAAGLVHDYSASFFLANAELPGLAANTVGVRRHRFIGEHVHERIVLQCFERKPVPVRLRLAVGTDFADLFEIKESVRDRSALITRDHAADGSGLTFRYTNGGFSVCAEVRVDTPATRVEGDDLVWDLELRPNETWRCNVTVPLELWPLDAAPVRRRFEEVFLGAPAGPEGQDHGIEVRRRIPRLRDGSELLRDVYDRSVSDLVAMRIYKDLRKEPEFRTKLLRIGRGDDPLLLCSAGLPWFLTIFGRDMLITAYQMIAFWQDLAYGVLVMLATHQATEWDDFRDAEPGKIMHEMRRGELTQLGLKPHSRYYGTADATQLWLILLSEYWRWTGDDQLVVALREHLDAALRWIDEYGDLDGDGYVEYATRSPQGLGNQCWRDSWNGVLFANGIVPYLPIATCELQGYSYDAKLRVAELADGPLADPALAQRLRTEAGALYERFNRDFWIDDRGGYYAVGLDGDKQRIDSLTSNLGHLLWSGIVPPDRARILAHQLLSDQLFSGWGVRTTASSDPAFNPIGYHMGTVWPHDNSIIVHGLARYGFREEANRIVMAMLEAAKHSNGRLPEAFSGYDRSLGRSPVQYPTACNPQAWASGAPLLFLRTVLGLDAVDGQVRLDPVVPAPLGRILLTGSNAFGKRWDIEAVGDQADIRLSGS